MKLWTVVEDESLLTSWLYLQFKGNTIFKREVATTCSMASKAYFESMASSYNKAGWEPTYCTWVMQAARILNDSINRDNERSIAHVWESKKPGKLSIACHCGAFFWTTQDNENVLRFDGWNILEIGKHTLTEGESNQLCGLIDLEALLLIIKERKERKPIPVKKGTKTTKEKNLEAAQLKLNAWNDKLAITKETP